MTLTRKQVAHIAELARLSLTEKEITLYQEQLSAVLEYAERLQAVETDTISPTATVIPVRNVMRDDTPCPSMTSDDVLANAPKSQDGCFQVPAVLE